MARKFLLFQLLAALLIGLVPSIFALEKIKLGTAIKMSMPYYLPALTAEEKGFWKENGLEVEWVPFAGGAVQMRAVASGALNIGLGTSAGAISAAAGGLPVLMVLDLVSSHPFYIWVRNDSPYRHPSDLKEARVGVTTLGGTTHAYGRVIIKAHGLEKDVRFVGAGGVRENIAGIRAGAFEAMVNDLGTGVDLKISRILREIASNIDYLPKPWFEQSVFVRKDFAGSKPDITRKVLRAVLQTTDFIQKNPRWAMDKIKSFQGLSEEAAKLIYEEIKFSITGKIDPKAVDNVRKFFIEYGIIREKAPAVEELYTNEYLS